MSRISHPSMTRSLLETGNLRAKKKFGQNFLIDANILDKIVAAAGLSSASHVLEIGPGLGALTQVLLEAAGHVTAFEIDGDMVAILKQNFYDNNHLTVVHQDFLEVDLGCFQGIPHLAVCANVPYNITSPILFKLIDSGLSFDSITLMVQKELGDRLLAPVSSSAYGALSVMLEYLYDRRQVQVVSRHCFYPKPQVDSVVLTLIEKKDRPKLDRKHFFAFIKEAFQQRRKTLYNNVKGLISKEDFEAWCQTQQVDGLIRPQDLSLAGFLSLYGAIYES